MRAGTGPGIDTSARVGAGASAVAAAGAAAWALPAPAAHLGALSRAFGVPTRNGDDAVALTFDDGPHRLGTPAVLRALAAGGVSATFFVVGEQVQRDPGIAREIVEAGHELAVHGHRHRTLLRLGPRALAEDLDRAEHLVAEAAGRPSRLHRAPYGVYTPLALREVRRRGWTPLLWSRWGRDWAFGQTPASIAARVTGAIGAGDVVLLHDADHYGTTGSWRATAAAVPRILEALAASGLTAGPFTRSVSPGALGTS